MMVLASATPVTRRMLAAARSGREGRIRPL
jgi:hypothetical protein